MAQALSSRFREDFFWSRGGVSGLRQAPPPGEFPDIVGEADEAPLAGDLIEPAHEELTKAALV